MRKISNKKCAIIPWNEPSPVGFINVFEQGDVWIKIQGCEKCSKERRKKCCGTCPMLTPDAFCFWHIKAGSSSSKPFYCAVLPTPDSCTPGCKLVYQCIKGSKKGLIRAIEDKRSIFR